MSLADWCDRVSSPQELLEKPRSYYQAYPADSEYFGPPDYVSEDDKTHFEPYGGTCFVDEYFLIRGDHYNTVTEPVFISSLQRPVVRRRNLIGYPRYHIFPIAGLAARESYHGTYFAETLCKNLREEHTLNVDEETVTCRFYREDAIQARVAEPCVLMSSLWMDNYAHWLIEVIPRLWYRDLCPELRDLPLVLPNLPQAGYQKETLSPLLGETRILPFPADHVQFAQLYVPSFLSPTGYSTRQIDYTNRVLRKAFEVEAAPAPKRRLYLSRADANLRRIANEDEVMAALSQVGFESILLGGLSVKEQIELFSQAEMIVGPHGAAFANIMFAPEGATILELMPESYRHPMYWIIAKLKKQFYARLPCKEIEKRRKLMVVDVDELMNVIKPRA